jgi:hypothetical protein
VYPNVAIVAARNVVAPVPPLAIGNVPVTPVVSGSPEALVSVADAGVPKAIALPVGKIENVTPIVYFNILEVIFFFYKKIA